MLEVKTVKEYLSIQHNSYDNQIKVLIPVAVDFINAYCNQSYTTSTLPSSIQYAAALIIEYEINNKNGITSESVGDASVSYTESYPANIVKLLNNHKIVRFN